jgi:hypothetical protein
MLFLSIYIIIYFNSYNFSYSTITITITPHPITPHPITTITSPLQFQGSPRVGDEAFKEAWDAQHYDQAWRMANHWDPVTMVSNSVRVCECVCVCVCVRVCERERVVVVAVGRAALRPGLAHGQPLGPRDYGK